MVTIVKAVVIPSATRAGTESGGIQNDIQLSATMMHDGMYVSIIKNPTRRFMLNFTFREENIPVNKFYYKRKCRITTRDDNQRNIKHFPY